MAYYYAMAIALVELQVLGKEPISNANSQIVGYPTDYYTNCHIDYPKGDPNSQTTLDYTVLMVSYRLVWDYMAVKLADYTAIDLIGLEIQLVGQPLVD